MGWVIRVLSADVEASEDTSLSYVHVSEVETFTISVEEMAKLNNFAKKLAKEFIPEAQRAKKFEDYLVREFHQSFEYF